MTSKIIDWDAGHVPLPNTITFKGSDSTWVLRITANRKIEVNEDVEVSVLAQQVLDAVQVMLKPKAWQSLSDDEITSLEYDHVSYETFDEGEYGTEINIYTKEFARAIEAKLKEKNND